MSGMVAAGLEADFATGEGVLLAAVLGVPRPTAVERSVVDALLEQEVNRPQPKSLNLAYGSVTSCAYLACFFFGIRSKQYSQQQTRLAAHGRLSVCRT